MAIFHKGNSFNHKWYNNYDKDITSMFSKNVKDISGTEYYINNLKTSSIFNIHNPDNTNNDNIIDTAQFGDYVVNSEHNSNLYEYENNFKLSKKILDSVSKNYKFIYQQAAKLLIDFGYSTDEQPGDTVMSYGFVEMPVVPSLFNPLFGLNIVGITGNTPLIDSDKKPEGTVSGDFVGEFTINNSVYGYSKDINNCSIKKLVELSEQGKMGRETYKFADFMYCKNLGKYANNRLITLRKFPLPIGDNIMKVDGNGNIGVSNIPIDVGRLVCWLDDENRLEDILKYDYSETWQERTAEYQDIQSKEEDGPGGLIGDLVNLSNPQYRRTVAAGWNSGTNRILDTFAGKFMNGKILSATGSNWTQNSEVLGRYDKNKIYEPTGTIKSTHLYEGTLNFTHNFTLVFDYELRAYENINPKTAFLDLLNNILQVTYRSGSFWGGAVWWTGSPANKRGWENAEAFMNGATKKLDDVFNMILDGNLNFGDLFGQALNKVTQIATGIVNAGKDLVMDPNGALSAAGRAIKDGAVKYNINSMLKGMFHNKLGRPALYAAHSILTGDPVGLWHVTIGNPRNPILSIGNLIIESSSVQHYGPLGFDDFPTGVKVTVTLKHGRPRDMVEIAKMYTGGLQGIGVPLGNGTISNYINPTRSVSGKDIKGPNIDAEQFATSWGNPIKSITVGLGADKASTQNADNTQSNGDNGSTNGTSE